MDDIKASMLHVSALCMQGKVGKGAKFLIEYNQLPHLTLDTIWESDKYTINIKYRRAKKSVLS